MSQTPKLIIVNNQNHNHNNNNNNHAEESKEGGPWSLYSWKKMKIDQQPLYENNKLLAECLSKVGTLPPMVHQAEIDRLKKLFVEVGTLSLSFSLFGVYMLLSADSTMRKLWRKNKKNIWESFGRLRWLRGSGSYCKLETVRSDLSTAVRSALKVFPFYLLPLN